MILYHGTWEENKDSILDSGIIECNSKWYSYEDTEILDNVFEKYLEYNPRNMCIYLSNDRETVEAYDYAFKIHTEDLNTNLLYVCNNKIMQDIYNEIEKETINWNKVEKLVRQYEDEKITFEEYLRTNGQIDYRLEFLYFGDIKVTEDNLY